MNYRKMLKKICNWKKDMMHQKAEYVRYIVEKDLYKPFLMHSEQWSELLRLGSSAVAIINVY